MDSGCGLGDEETDTEARINSISQSDKHVHPLRQAGTPETGGNTPGQVL